MKKFLSRSQAVKLALGSLPALLLLSSILLSSFTVHRFADEFLKQLGISKTDADQKITNSILGGSLDAYGVKNAKNIAAGNRKAVVMDLLAYTKKQVNSEAFKKEYNAMKQSNKPTLMVAQTPEEMRTQIVATMKKSVVEVEAMVKNADAKNKALFEPILVEAQKRLKEAEDPNAKQYVNYAKNYEGLVSQYKELNEKHLAHWEEKYPSNHLLYVKTRLLDFMEETKDIDFTAELVTKGGIKYFANPAYERKGNRWKMAFRAGKEVVEPAREFVQKWIDEIK